MSVDVSAEVTIARPRGEVAAYMFDPRHDAEWTGGLIEARPLADGLLRKGVRVERISKMLGRRFGYVIEVLDHADERWVEMLSTEPFEMRVRYELEDAEARAGEPGTRARIRASGAGGAFFRIAAPLLSRVVRRSIQNDLEMLKEILESGADRA